MTAAELLASLQFRRQFLLGPESCAPTPHWTHRALRHGFILSAHPDLQVVSESRGDAVVTLLGFVLDPFKPARTEADIVHSLTAGASDILKLISLTKPLAGRWAVIYQDPAGTFLFTDPCGFRTVFFYHDGCDVWCGSQPEIIKAKCSLRSNMDCQFLQFLNSPTLGRGESAWIGTQTVYEGCLHLLPNHYLDVNRLEQVRFFPKGTLPDLEASAVAETSRAILEGIFAGIVGRQKVTMALTAGWDSRILLAASKHVAREVQYYLDRMGVLPEHHPDVQVPRRLAKRLGVSFITLNSDDFTPGWLSSALAANVTGARALPKTRTICAMLLVGEERIIINGVGGEISRNNWDSGLDLDAVTSSDLVRMFWIVDHPFSVREAERWQRGLPALDERVNSTVLFFWEQRLGNWGAQYVAEQDIAVDTLHPYNCRLLIETLLATPRRARAAPDFPLHRQLAQAMWPEVLSVPFCHNVRPRVVTFDFGAAKERVRSYVPTPIVERMKELTSGVRSGRSGA